MFDQVNGAFHKDGSINSHSLIKSLKSFMLEVRLDPPNFSELFLMTLKSPPTQHNGKDRPKMSNNSTKKSFISKGLFGP